MRIIVSKSLAITAVISFFSLFLIVLPKLEQKLQNREIIDQKPIEQELIHQEATDQEFLDEESEKQPEKFDIKRALEQKSIIPVAIIGAGPAGLCIAIYTGRAKLPTYVYTGGNIGGYLNEIKNIENWPAYSRSPGAKIAEKLYAQVESFGVKFIHDKVVSIDLSQWPYRIETPDSRAYALSVVIATGFSPKKVNVPGADKYWGLGVSTCTLCDAPFHKGQEVVISGGDDYAAERALQLAAYAKKVTMIIKEPHLTATAIMQDYLKARPNVVMLFNSEISRIIGDDKGVTGVEIYDYQEKANKKLPAQGVYVNSTFIPNTQFLKDQPIVMDPEGYITLIPGTQQTSIPGVFAAGAVADNKYRKAITACGDGGRAGIEVIDFMHQKVGFHNTDQQETQQALLDIIPAPQEEITTLKTQKDLRDLLPKHDIVVLYFYRLLCPYCQEIISDIYKAKTDFGDAVHVVKANAHAAEQLARDIDVDGVPYIVVYKNGILQERLRGVEIKNKLYSTLEKLVTAK